MKKSGIFPNKHVNSMVREVLQVAFLLLYLTCKSQPEKGPVTRQVRELDNSFFTSDQFWRGADGAASVILDDNRILWLFSDTFIDVKGKGDRKNAVMINNTLGIQEGTTLDPGIISFYFKGESEEPRSFFELPGESWFWTGHAVVIQDKLFVFLMEMIRIDRELGFEAIGWYVVQIDNPQDHPDTWKMSYLKGPDTQGVILGSSAVLKDDEYLYAFGVKEPSTHEVYLGRIPIEEFQLGQLGNIEWWAYDKWQSVLVPEEGSHLFIGQTEFSVHRLKDQDRYIQIQTFGFGHCKLGYRLADNLYGPWSDPVYFYTPEFKKKEYGYTANSHPELSGDGIYITYNVNHQKFSELVKDEGIYFPRIIHLEF